MTHHLQSFQHPSKTRPPSTNKPFAASSSRRVSSSRIPRLSGGFHSRRSRRAIANSSLQLVCRSLQGPHVILDIDTAVLFVDLPTLLDVSRLRTAITNVTTFYPRFATVHLVLTISTDNTSEIASSVLALQAGIMVLPFPVECHFG